MPTSPDECARELLEVVPLVMRTIRSEMRSNRTPELTVPQFRALVFLNRHEGASLSEVAEHLGLTLPSVSKLMDGLVARRLATREVDPRDRRRVTLALTEQGRTVLQHAYDATQNALAEVLITLTPAERTVVAQAMQALRPLFTSRRQAGTETTR